MAASAHLPLTFQTTFTHACHQRLIMVQLGWFQIRFADLPQPLWMLIARRSEEEDKLILLTTIPLTDATQARLAYDQWRLRSALEHTYRFDPEQGLDVEDMRVQSLETMRRLFLLVLLTALFAAHLAVAWPQPAVGWLRSLGGKHGLPADLDGLSLLLAGISFVFTTAATLSFTLTPFLSLLSLMGNHQLVYLHKRSIIKIEWDFWAKHQEGTALNCFSAISPVVYMGN